MHAVSEVARQPGIIETTVRDAIAWLDICRGRSGNAFNNDVLAAIQDAVVELSRGDVRVLVIRGGGQRAFGSGMDLNELRTLTPVEAQAHFDVLNACLDAIEKAPMPTIAMVRGYAVGGGFELAAACDLRVAGASARVGVPIGRIGHCVDRQNLHRLLRLVSPAHVKQLIMTDQLLLADEAQRIGYFNWVVPDFSLDDFTASLAATVASKAPLGMRALKQVVNEVLDGALAPAADPEQDVVASLLSTRDFQEGVAAFLERRKPVFEGR